MSRTAIVILNYNGEELLQQFLPSVLQNACGAEVIVADNASTDHSVALVQKEFPTVKLILLDENYGFCGGYNRALKQISADYCVLLNSDVEVTPGWLSPMVNLLEDDPRIAAIQPKICSFHQKDKFEYAGAAGGFIDSLGYPFCRGRVFDYIEYDKGQYNDVREVFWASGACFIIRTEVFRNVGGFDEDFFAHMEEIDLCWKIRRTNQLVYYCGSSMVYHVGAGTLAYGNPTKIYLNFRNGLSLIYKHLGRLEVIYKLPFRICLDWLAALRFLVKGQARNAKAVFLAHRDFLKNAAGDRSKRREIQKQGSYSRKGIRQGLIVFDYFVLGKKTFR